MKEKIFRPENMDKSMTPDLREPAIHPEGNAIFGYDGGNHFVRKEGPVRGVSFAVSENLQLASHPAKPAFHRMKYVFELCHPGKQPFHRMKQHFCSRKVNCPKKNVSSTQGFPRPVD